MQDEHIVENNGLVHFETDMQDKTLENELNLWATVYLNFNDGNDLHCSNSMISNGLYNKTAEEVRNDTIDFLKDVSSHYKDTDKFLAAVKEECDCLSEYAKKAINERQNDKNKSIHKNNKSEER